MEENKNLVTEVTENVEQPTEETQQPPAKTYSQDEVDVIVGKAKARAKAQIEKKYERKYGNLENVLKAGTGKESVEEITDTFTAFYKGKGIEVQPKPAYSSRDIEVLANAEAQDVISGGYEDVVEEVDRLAEIGVENMDARERAYFNALCKHRQNTERQNELAKIGITEDVYNSQEFQEYAGMFKADTPISKIYDSFRKQQPKKDIKPMGSLSNKTSDEGTVKDFYSRDEALRFTREDFDKNPALFEAVQKSMLKW